MDAAEYSRQPRDSKQENEIASWLRSINDERKFEFLWTLAKLNPQSACPLIKRAQLASIFHDALLEYGLVYGDASSVQLWLDATHEGLGPDRFIQTIQAHLDNAPLVVSKAMYFLPSYFRDNGNYQSAVSALKQAFEQKYPNFSSLTSVGIHATGA